MEAFYYFYAVNEGQERLKKEISFRLQDQLRPSFACKELLTYKGDDTLVLPSEMFFALCYGKSLGPIGNKEQVQAMLAGMNAATLNNWTADNFTLSEEQALKPSTTIIDIIPAGKDHYLIGEHQRRPFDFINHGRPSSPTKVPSRAYHKIAEAFHLLAFAPKENERALDLGCAPGGASFFFLENACHVIGVDTAEMDPLCTQNPRFLHLKRPLQKISAEQLADFDYDWMTSDINLDPLVVLAEIERLLQKLRLPRALFFTVKITHKFNPFADKHGVKEIKARLIKRGFKQVQALQLPAHRGEFLLLALS